MSQDVENMKINKTESVFSGTSQRVLGEHCTGRGLAQIHVRENEMLAQTLGGY